MQFQYDDGGRSAAGWKGIASDCVVRSIAIATEQTYQSVYDELYRRNLLVNRNPKRSSPRNGNTCKGVIKVYLQEHGWKWIPTMFFGKGCKVHLKEDELPTGRIITVLSRHMTAVIDGIIHDIYDPSRMGTRCVYGYFTKEN